MKLIDMAVKEYLELLNSDTPAPGGGAAGGISAAQGIALTGMVVELTVGKERYRDFEKLCLEKRKTVSRLFDRFNELVDEDKAAYLKVASAYKMPKDTDGQKSARSAEIAAATVNATAVPYELMSLSLEGLKVTEELIGNSNPNLISDLGAAAVNLLAALKSAWLNVAINLPNIKDEALAAKFAAGKDILKEGEIIADRIYVKVREALEK